MDTTTLRYFAPLFFIAYFGAAFVWPSLRVYQKTGKNPVTFGGADTAHDFIGTSFKVLLALVAGTLCLFASGSETYSYLLPAHYLEQPLVQWIGVALCLLSLGWTLIAQWQMGTSWRIGIDGRDPGALVTKGLFARSRNPIFLGMQITLLGLFLITPNALTAAVLISGWLLIQIQARLEEPFLEGQYGDAYQKYRVQVPRFL